MQLPEVGAPFARCSDDATSGGAPCSRWLHRLCRRVLPAGRRALDGLDDDLRAAWRRGLHALIVAPCGLGGPLVGLPASTEISSCIAWSRWPPARAAVSRNGRAVAGRSRYVDSTWPDATGAAGLFDCAASADHATYTDATARIHDWIAAGDTYEVNYTYRLRMTAFGAPAALVSAPARAAARALTAHSSRYRRGGAILSCSLELFFSHHAGQLVARPMKGTAPATGNVEIDEARATALAADEKNRRREPDDRRPVA
ncbi:chorismate-binding protein [Cupriavidus basilensis]